MEQAAPPLAVAFFSVPLLLVSVSIAPVPYITMMMMSRHARVWHRGLNLRFPAHHVVNQTSHHNRKNKMYSHHIPHSLFQNPNGDSRSGFAVA